MEAEVTREINSMSPLTPNRLAGWIQQLAGLGREQSERITRLEKKVSELNALITALGDVVEAMATEGPGRG